MFTVFTIKGLYLNAIDKQNPTYAGKLKDCMRYVDNNEHRFLHYGSGDIEICIDDEIVAIKKCNENVDEIGIYYTYDEWKII